MLQNYLLELNGKAAGRFFDITGGTAEGEVVTHSTGAAKTKGKHIGFVRYQDMLLTCGTGMSYGFYEWLGTSFGGAISRMNGAVIALDNNQKPIGRLEFGEALVKSLVLPALERSANKEAFLSVSISPEWTKRKDADPKTMLGVYASALPKSWNIGSFRLQIDGLEADCARVTRIGSLKLGKEVINAYVGDARDSVREPAGTEYSNLVVTLPGMAANGFDKWFEDFVVNGNNSNTAEKRGSLEFFAPGSTRPYFLIGLDNIGIMKIQGSSAFREKSAAPISVEMYCETMKFKAGVAAVK